MAIIIGSLWINYQRFKLTDRVNILNQLTTRNRVSLEPNVNSQPEIEIWRSRQQSPDIPVYSPNTNTHSSFRYYKPIKQAITDGISIIDMDANDGSGYKVIQLPSVPKELEWNTESIFSVIKSIGRNTSFYHYTGGEAKLEFEIDWYSTSWDSKEVIRNCRVVEALSKADGYTGNPHRVMLQWGNGNVLFNEIYFQITSAPYRLLNFNKSRRGIDGNIEMTHMLPTQAYQKVTMVRIDSENIGLDEIRRVGSKPK